MKLVSLQDENKEITVGDLIVSGGITSRITSFDEESGEIYAQEVQGGTTHVLTAEQAGARWLVSGAPSVRFEKDGDTKDQPSHAVRSTAPDGSASGASPEDRTDSSQGDTVLEAELDAKAHEEAAAAKRDEAAAAAKRKK